MRNRPTDFERSDTLDILEKKVWGEPDFDSHLVTECHRLRKIPLDQFTPENLRIMIGQDIGLPYLLPIALEVLEENCWVAGDHYEGDLLFSVLRASSEFWYENPEYASRLEDIMSSLKQRCEFFNKELHPAWLKIYGGA